MYRSGKKWKDAALERFILGTHVRACSSQSEMTVMISLSAIIFMSHDFALLRDFSDPVMIFAMQNSEEKNNRFIGHRIFNLSRINSLLTCTSLEKKKTYIRQ